MHDTLTNEGRTDDEKRSSDALNEGDQDDRNTDAMGKIDVVHEDEYFRGGANTNVNNDMK